ncbi:ribosomal protein S18 acetylase RimI-like enzyme [Comamonas odontotermitis]|uniref:Ribosomal protein S18 acetylase RimI-like enzyme n=1 Tax=Comamonas odontotermitis TaxID=379895 RepID=A0ABR6RAC8_9BURK|nr:GNAT family N-acetyltransferase [Comamonas odontotermitis]MBB6576101.1 ribosomal protein S18 acetylase RimI-like enzyme [Comamonas odontotermitis]
MKNRPVQIRSFAATDLEGAFELLTAHGWAHRIPNRPFLERLITASQRVAVATSQGQVIGFARAITDGLSNGYLSMVVVAPQWRGRGIGKSLVDEIVKDDDSITWVLRASRAQAPAFFAKLGFVPSNDAMERARREAPTGYF